MFVRIPCSTSALTLVMQGCERVKQVQEMLCQSTAVHAICLEKLPISLPHLYCLFGMCLAKERGPRGVLALVQASQAYACMLGSGMNLCLFYNNRANVPALCMRTVVSSTL